MNSQIKNKAVYWGTGRRKTSVARVRLVPGSGQIKINGRTGGIISTLILCILILLNHLYKL